MIISISNSISYWFSICNNTFNSLSYFLFHITIWFVFSNYIDCNITIPNENIEDYVMLIWYLYWYNTFLNNSGDI